VDDERVPGGTPLGGKDAGDGLRAEGVGSEAVDGLRGEGDEVAGAEKLGGTRDVSGVGGLEVESVHRV
jgi:hypothetical protein